MPDAAIEFDALSHHYGSGELRRRVLDGVSGRISPGEIVILTGPSGSGKTTLLTLMGALRSAQEGRLSVLGEELRGAGERVLRGVRRRIGYIFQAHNLLRALTSVQNVEMTLRLQPLARSEARERALAALAAVELEDLAHKKPGQLSGGQAQRVAIARAIVTDPQLILADEPTASLDSRTGRAVAELLRSVARDRGATVLLVTHDNRILDIADRIIHLEDGRISSFRDAVARSTRSLMETLSEMHRHGELARSVREMPADEFSAMLEQMTVEARRLVHAVRVTGADAFTAMLDEVVEAAVLKLGDELGAERASLLMLDPRRDELFFKVARPEGGRPLEQRIPAASGIAGHVLRSGVPLRIAGVYDHPLFNPEVDRATGFRSRDIVCVPLRSSDGQVFAVAQLVNRVDGAEFDADDEARVVTTATSLAPALETWWRLEQGD